MAQTAMKVQSPTKAITKIPNTAMKAMLVARSGPMEPSVGGHDGGWMGPGTVAFSLFDQIP